MTTTCPLSQIPCNRSQLARKIGRDRRTVANWWNGKSRVPRTTRAAVDEALGVAIDWAAHDAHHDQNQNTDAPKSAPLPRAGGQSGKIRPSEAGEGLTQPSPAISETPHSEAEKRPLWPMIRLRGSMGPIDLPAIERLVLDAPPAESIVFPPNLLGELEDGAELDLLAAEISPEQLMGEGC